MIEDFPLDDKEKINILDMYQNMVLDENSNIECLAKYVTIPYLLISESSD